MSDATAVTAALNFIHAINARSEDTLAALMTDDHEFIDSGGESWRGRAIMRKNWREYFRLFPDYTITLKRVRLHQSRVVLRGVSSGALSAYGQETLRRADGTLPADTDLQGPAIWTALAKGSKVAQWRVYGDTPEVRAALNLKVAATPIAIVDYDLAWPDHFAAEAARLQRAIGQQARQIEHIGSTSVPGLAAKPTIDIMVGVETLADADRCVPPVVALGYTYAPEHEGEMPYRRYFSRSGTPNWHIHMV
ncbi:MAG: GrpB family protein, partial [Anaerolineae bacterium]|nr:GrpB family protein [Anaerolineae bacterium]